MERQILNIYYENIKGKLFNFIEFYFSKVSTVYKGFSKDNIKIFYM